ncbi:MAG: hypothetical protein DRP84_01780 [Spirochaetes bacterium]|nr:MAG: hypothetical protein DRP84_01780 [Spirochaetota bacterium]
MIEKSQVKHSLKKKKSFFILFPFSIIVQLFSFILLFILLFFLPGCITYTPYQEKPYKPTRKKEKQEPKIRLLLFNNRTIYHIFTESEDIVIETSNKMDGNIQHYSNSVGKSEGLEVRIKGNNVLIQNKYYPLPCRIKNLRKFKIGSLNLYGDLVLYRDSLVLEMPIERYVEGVIASEVGTSWPIEALKAQAVVSRTYAVYSILHSKNSHYDLGTSELHQKYELKESIDSVKKAVDATRGIIIYYHSEPIQAFYHSCSGGITESGGNVFSKDLPYLKSIRDPYSRKCPDKYWKLELTSDEILRSLGDIKPASFNNKEITDIQIGAKTSSGRVKFFILRFGREKVKIRGNAFRLAMGAKSFKSLLIIRIIKKQRENNKITYEFIGKGYGHGVGMSQWGAKNMAMQGFSYTSIIKFYYRGVNLDNYNKLHIVGS